MVDRMRRIRAGLIPACSLLLLAGPSACREAEPTDTAPATSTAEPLPLSPTEALTRVSLDLRGVRPSAEDYRRVHDEPEALEDLVETYLQDPRFGSRMADLWSEILLTRTDYYNVDISDYGIYDISSADFAASVGDEPLQMIARVADEDLPWTELVTGDWTMANEVLARVWPVSYPEGETGWQPAQYEDGRPAAGILSTNAMWWRYGSTDSNANRKRANQVSRIFLCNDYLVRPIEFDRNLDLLDEEAVLDALATNPSCVNCHVSLDPLASYFYGFWYYDEYSAGDITEYHPERELTWQDQTGVAPGFYGEPGYTLRDLGQQLAADSRFVECAVEQATELLLGRDAELPDLDRMTQHREAFLAGELELRQLIRSVVLSPEYLAAEGAQGVSRKLASPDLLATQIEEITGYVWVSGGYDQLRTSELGYRTLAGGTDGYFVTRNADSPNATLVLVQQRLAEAASAYVVAADAALPPEERRLLSVASLEESSAEDPSIADQIAELHLRIFGEVVAPDSEAVLAYVELWADLYGIEQDPLAAWAGVLAAHLRDPELVLY